MFAGITQKGVEFGIGNDRFDGYLQGNFCYLSAYTTYSAWTVTFGPKPWYLSELPMTNSTRF